MSYMTHSNSKYFTLRYLQLGLVLTTTQALAFVEVHMFSLQNTMTQEKCKGKETEDFDLLASVCVFPCAFVLSILTGVLSALMLVLAS